MGMPLGFIPCVRIRTKELAAGFRASSDLDSPVFAQNAIRVVALAQAAYATAPRGDILSYLSPLFQYRNYPRESWCCIVDDLTTIGVLNCSTTSGESILFEGVPRPALLV